MDNNSEYIRTEQWALEKEQKEQTWQETYAVKAEEHIRKINELLAEGNRDSRQRVRDMFLDYNFFRNYRHVDIFAWMYIVMQIYGLEEARGISKTILDQADTVAGLVDSMFDFRMILYRLDFGIGQEAERELLLFIREHCVSSEWMKVMMTTSVIRPLVLVDKLEKIFAKAGMEELWLAMLGFKGRFLKFD